jgi:DNA-binding response OmpR family regulator
LKVLVVEDSARLRNSLQTALQHHGYAVDTAGDGEEGLWMAESHPYDLIILDLMLPQLDGITVLKKLREKNNRTHVLILTARDRVEDRVNGLQSGGDDYLVKPFALAELLARVQALCRRSYSHKDNVVRLGNVQLDLDRKTMICDGKEFSLPRREYALLEYLALRKGQVVTRSEIEAHIYDSEVDPMSNVVDSAVCNLRRQLQQAGSSAVIQTRRGIGYLLEVGT